jgi:hypothetical protein
LNIENGKTTSYKKQLILPFSNIYKNKKTITNRGMEIIIITKDIPLNTPFSLSTPQIVYLPVSIPLATNTSIPLNPKIVPANSYSPPIVSSKK